MYARIYWVDNFRGMEGYRCDLRGRAEDELGMSWFIPSTNRMVHNDILFEIKKLIDLGYKIDMDI